MPRTHRLWRLSLLVAALSVVPGRLPGQAQPQAAPYVALSDPAYRDLEVLVALGLVRREVLGQRPYTRRTFARAVLEARGANSGREAASHRLRQLLERLESRFPVPDTARAGLDEFAGHVTWARSRHRDISLHIPGSIDQIDADLAPLLQGNQGVELADGWTGSVVASARWALGPHLAGGVRPRLWLTGPGDPPRGSGTTLDEAYVRAVFSNLALVLGRSSVLHGHARSYGPVLSGNARGFDQVRASMEHPTRLPWIFRHLGPSSFAFGAAYMGKSQDTPGSWLFTYEGAVKPHPNLEWGFILLNHQGGEGSPEATFWERIRDLLFLEERRFLPFSALPLISDKVLGGDLALVIPAMGTKLYVEMMTTDDHNFFTEPATGLWHNAAWTGGVRVMGLGADARTDVWLEGSHAGVLAYTHYQFTSGMTLDGRVLGSPLGPLGSGWEGGLRWTGPRNVFQFVGAWERYAGDTYHHEGAVRVRTADNPDEIRLRALVDWTRTSDSATGLRTQVKLGYEHVIRFDFTDQNRNNFLVQVSAGYVWN